jgi:hypothetical protein
MRLAVVLAVVAALACSQVARAKDAPPRLAEACGSTSGVDARAAGFLT